MIFDTLNTFARATALSTSGTGRQVVGDQIDLRLTSSNVGAGKPLYIVIRTSATFTSGGSATVDFEVVSDATAALATDGSSTRHLSTGSLALAALAANQVLLAAALPQMGNYERFLGIVANVGTAALTAGSIDAFLTYDPPDAWRSYADASN